MSFSEKKLREFRKFGSKLGLERMKKLADLLDDPQEGLSYIHIGGTNGKGSVTNYIYSVLKANGYSVGSFSSPFMEGFRESIIVDDIPISEEELVSYFNKIETAITTMKKEGYETPTEFEVITALAFLYFKEKMPDFVILEVGLGGIGDSTNIIDKPLLSVICAISLDHCDVLGDTVEKIARQKAGIIKEKIPVISNVSDPVAAKVIAREAYNRNSHLINAVKYRAKVKKGTPAGSDFSVDIDGINYPDMSIGMVGEHQIRNAVCALTVVEQLRKKSLLTLDREATIDGLKSAKLMGRFEIIERDDKPLIIMDGAHNEEGAVALRKTILDFYPDKKILTVFALMKDKNHGDIIDIFLDFTDEIIIADILNDRGIDSGALLGSVGNIPCRIIDDRNELIKVIKSDRDHDIILITGSLYLIRDLHGELV